MRATEVICLLVFIAVAAWIVWFFRNRASSLSDYYIGGRNIGGWVSAFTWSASAASAGLFLGGAGMTYTFGWPGMMYQFGSLAGVFIAWLLLAPRLRRLSARLGVMTTPRFVSERFGADILKLFTALWTVIFVVPSLIVQFKGAGLLLESYLGIDYVWGMVLFGVVLGVFTAAGGFVAVAYLDVLTGTITTLGMLVILPVALHAVGGFSALNAKLAAINPGMVGWVGSMPKSLLIGLTVLYVVSFWGQPHLAPRFYALKNTSAVRVAFPLSQILSTFWMLSGCIIGLVARVLWPSLKTGDLAMPMAIQSMLGVGGIVVWLALLAAIFDTVNALLLVVGTNVSHDIVKGYISRGMSERAELIVSKLACFVICAISLVLALNPAPLITIVHSISMGAFSVFLGIPLAVGVFWRRANAPGAAVAVIGGPVFYILWKLFLVKPTGLHEMVGSLLVTVPLVVLVTLATRPPVEREVQRFFASAD